MTPQKAPSPPYLSPIKPTEVVHVSPRLFELLQLNPADLSTQINVLREESIPAAKRVLHDLLKDHLRKIIHSEAEILHKMRCNLRLVALESCLDGIKDLQLLRLRTRKHRFTLRGTRNDQLKAQLL